MRSKHWRENITFHSMDLLTPNSPGVFQLCLWPLIASGYLGEGCHASHQSSDVSTPSSSTSTVSVFSTDVSALTLICLDFKGARGKTSFQVDVCVEHTSRGTYSNAGIFTPRIGLSILLAPPAPPGEWARYYRPPGEWIWHCRSSAEATVHGFGVRNKAGLCVWSLSACEDAWP